MLATLKARRDREEGFTLIELMVVVLIIAILIAIAIPTFLGARERAQERAAQSSIRNELTAAKTLFTDNESYNSLSVATLTDVEPSLDAVVAATNSTGPNEISFQVRHQNASNLGEIVVLSGLSKNGTCFYMQDVSIGGAVQANPGTYFYSVDNANGVCNANGAPASGNASWVDAW